MLGTALSTLSKLDLSRLDGSDVGRIATILRDSARFDAGVSARQARRLAKRGGTFIASHPKQTGLGLGGVALLGLAGYAAYRYLSSPSGETLLDKTADDNAEVEHRAGVADSVSEPA